ILLQLYWQWRSIPDPVWTVENPIAATALKAIFWFGWGVALLSPFLVDHFELSGLSQVFSRLRNRESRLYDPRSSSGVCGIRSIWTSCSGNAGHDDLLFAGATNVLIAIQSEERDLIHFFGDRYRRYPREVARSFLCQDAARHPRTRARSGVVTF